jgi:hypothetical protein
MQKQAIATRYFSEMHAWQRRIGRCIIMRLNTNSAIRPNTNWYMVWLQPQHYSLTCLGSWKCVRYLAQWKMPVADLRKFLAVYFACVHCNLRLVYPVHMRALSSPPATKQGVLEPWCSTLNALHSIFYAQPSDHLSTMRCTIKVQFQLGDVDLYLRWLYRMAMGSQGLRCSDIFRYQLGVRS